MQYRSQIRFASGANGSYTYAVTSGTLPAGHSLKGANGQITGTPTSSTAQTFTITAKDSSGSTGTRSYTETPVLSDDYAVPQRSQPDQY